MDRIIGFVCQPRSDRAAADIRRCWRTAAPRVASGRSVWDRRQLPGSNVQSAPPPPFSLIAFGSRVQDNFDRLSKFDPAAPSEGIPAIASEAKISLASRPFRLRVLPLKVSSQERADMSTLEVRHTILSAVMVIFLVQLTLVLPANNAATAFFCADGSGE